MTRLNNYSQINNFFCSFIDEEVKNNVGVIIVTHILPDRHVFLDALSKVVDILAIIPKTKSTHAETLNELKTKYKFISLDREQIQTTTEIDDIIENYTGKVILLDIGGYFAPIVNRLKDKFPEKLLGVVEDTENGQQKYEKIKNLKCTVASVARSPLKIQEDYLIGQSLFFSTEVLLREMNVLPNYLKTAVIGFGKIGQSVAEISRLRNIAVSVYDINPILRINALCKGYEIPERNIILSENDLIFCCTGNKAVSMNDLKHIRNGCFITSSTSADDELDLAELERTFQRTQVTKHIAKYTQGGKYFYLLNEGNATNFIHNAVVGDFIFIVQSEIIENVKQIYYDYKNLPLKVHELSDDQRRDIASRWISSMQKRFPE